MNKMKNSRPGQKAITQEAKKLDGIKDLQECIRMAARLDERVIATEKYNARQTPEEPKETPVVTPNEIKDIRDRDMIDRDR